MRLVRLLLPRGGAQRWHAILRDRLAAAGAVVEVAMGPGARQPAALALCEELERLLYGAHGLLCEPAEAQQIAPAAATGPALVLDLTGAPETAAGAIAPHYDGAPGDFARDAALLDNRMPRLSFARETADGLEVFAEGLPAHEKPWLLRAGREAIAARLLALAPNLLALASNQLALAPNPPNQSPHGTGAKKMPHATAAHTTGAARFFVGGLVGRARARLARLTMLENHWRIGWRPLGHNGGAMARQDWGEGAWTWLADDARRYFADPFPYEFEGRTYLFCEEYPYATGKGVISVVPFDTQGRAQAPRVVLEADCHLSYPVVFQHGGEIWMMPESSAGGRLDLYRAERFPDRWAHERVLIDGLDISDATPFEAHGRWWLTATTRQDGVSSWDCLSLFAGESPLGPWRRCGDGPVLVDASCARPAGFVQTIGGALWRPAQDCVAGYGAGLALCRIDHVGEDGFAQTVVARLGPPAGGPPDGAHTLNLGAGMEWIDAVGPQSRRAPAEGAS
ncbi:MAG: hypothetical protein ACK5JM_15330 [Rhodoblastus sp.]